MTSKGRLSFTGCGLTWGHGSKVTPGQGLPASGVGTQANCSLPRGGAPACSQGPTAQGNYVGPSPAPARRPQRAAPPAWPTACPPSASLAWPPTPLPRAAGQRPHVAPGQGLSGGGHSALPSPWTRWRLDPTTRQRMVLRSLASCGGPDARPTEPGEEGRRPGHSSGTHTARLVLSHTPLGASSWGERPCWGK